MGQLVCEEVPSVRRVRRVFAVPERDVGIRRVRARQDGFGRARGALVGVDADLAEVAAKAGLHEAPHLEVERPAR
jgi:hypothetical protein